MTEPVARVRRFDADPDEHRDFSPGRFDLARVGPGDLLVIGPGHDSVVIGDEPYVSIHFGGANGRATK